MARPTALLRSEQALKALIDGLAAGQSRMTLDQVRAMNTENTSAVVDVIDVALDRMIARAADQPARRRGCCCGRGSCCRLRSVSAGGFLMVRRRVSQRIPALTGTIDRLALQDFSVEIRR